MLYDLVGDFLDIALAFLVGIFTADKSLRGKKGVFGVDNSLTLGRDTD